jgi:hypothetical protein
MTQSRSSTRASTKIGSPSGSPKAVTPPTVIPVTTRISSAEAKEHFTPPSRSRTVWFTSSRVVARITHAAYCFGSFFDATMIVLAARSGG